MHLYHLRRVQVMAPDDYLPRLNFSRLCLQQISVKQTFPADVLLIDDSIFSLLYIFNIHNFHSWAHGNRYGTIETPTKKGLTLMFGQALGIILSRTVHSI